MPAAASARHKPGQRAARLPAYGLYGEQRPVAHDQLHCESIAERSRLHGWEIRPHQHGALCQLLLVQRGQAQALLEGDTVTLQGPAVVTVPALSAHGFRFAPDIEGWVFTVDEAHLARLLQPHPGLLASVMRLRVHALAADDDSVPAAALALRDQALGHGAWRAAALDAALLRLLVAVARVVGPPAPGAAARGAAPPPARALAHVQRLRALVDAQFRRQPTQAALAAQLGITPTQLNRACQQVLGHPAQAVLQARLLLQAQRELAYTTLSIKQIAFELGYADAAYFTRCFSRATACSPRAWRRAQQGLSPRV